MKSSMLILYNYECIFRPIRDFAGHPLFSINITVTYFTNIIVNSLTANNNFIIFET